MRNKMILWGLVLALCLPAINAFAEFRSPQKQKKGVPGEPKAGNNAKLPPKIGPAPCQEGSVLGHTYCPDQRTIQHVYICRNGRRVISESHSCPQEQPVQEEQPAQGQPSTVLARCGIPAGGWQPNRTYILESDVRLEDDRRGACFGTNVPDDQSPLTNTTLDCQGHSIIGLEGRLGVGVSLFGPLNNVTVQNCIFESLAIGVGISSERATLRNNTFRNNRIGLEVFIDSSRNSPAGRVQLQNNQSCNNSLNDLECNLRGSAPADFMGAQLSGNNNQVRILHMNCQDISIPEGIVVPCQ